jgi:hypothetical protein
MSTYIPEENDDLILWAENFKKTFPAYAEKNGFSPENIKVALSACDRLISMCQESLIRERKGTSDQNLDIQKTEFAMALACLYNKK